MKRVPKKIVIPLAATLVVFFLTILPMGPVKGFIKRHMSWTMVLRDKYEEMFRTPIEFGCVQDYLHFPFFAGLGFLWMRFFSRRRVSFLKAVVLAFLAVALFSFFDEVIQSLVPSRDASWSDFRRDLWGGAIGIVVYGLWSRFKRSRDV